MFGYVYKTTNLMNGKIYIGQHKKNSFDTEYFGSGELIGKALKKYGKENFTCEIIDTASSYDELNQKETFWINSENSLVPNGYNIRPGGFQSPLNPETIEKIRSKNVLYKHKSEAIEKIKKSSIERWKNKEFKDNVVNKIKESWNNSITRNSRIENISKALQGKSVSEKTKKKLSIINTGAGNPNWGTHRSEETKEKIRQTRIETERRKKLCLGDA